MMAAMLFLSVLLWPFMTYPVGAMVAWATICSEAELGLAELFLGIGAIVFVSWRLRVRVFNNELAPF